MNDRFTGNELMMAKSVDLVSVAEHLGYTPVKVGRYYSLKEMDSIRIYNRKNWYRWSGKGTKNGGSQIDFLMEFGGMDIKEAIFWLLDFAGYKRDGYERAQPELKHQVQEVQREKKEFILPTAHRDNKRLYEYLQHERGLNKSTIDYFVNRGLIYESSPYHNIVFKGNDKEGVTRFASMRGIYDYRGKPFKCDVAGNDKNYCFHLANEESRVLLVFEAAIDMMSYLDVYQNYDDNLLALGMVADRPLDQFLRDYPQIRTIRFCLDNDEPGREATRNMMNKYMELGYQVEDVPAPAGYKDYNEWLVAAKKQCQGEIIPKAACR